ncbi:Spy/CpxP family protein refolding chaperone [Neptuniibacter sp. SY11_33]|uniref:Spy/CpxP family protein refolding chaperone n=1 Tax=Neptuniibacter sp. SY11_33 TaxID=3398215 RepID=UPI0039F4B653
MNRKLMTGIAAAVLTVSSLGVAHAYTKDHGAKMEKRLQYLSEELGLTTSQQTALKETMQQKKVGMKDQHQAKRDIRQQLMQLDPASKDYQLQLNSLVLKAQEQTKAMIMAKAKHQEELYEILTPEQEAKFAQLKSEAPKKWMKHKSEHRKGKQCH